MGWRKQAILVVLMLSLGGSTSQTYRSCGEKNSKLIARWRNCRTLTIVSFSFLLSNIISSRFLFEAGCRLFYQALFSALWSQRKVVISDVTMSLSVIRYDYDTIITKNRDYRFYFDFFQSRSLDAITPHRPTPTLYRVMCVITSRVTPV